MNGCSLSKTVRITDPLGFHMRPKASFARAASGFQSTVRLSWAGQSADGKSMLDLMLLAAPQGSEMVVEVSGPDAPAALDALVAVLLHPGEEVEEDPLGPSPEQLSQSTSEPF